MSREFLLPDLGSGLKEGEIVQWRVAVGDVVTTDDLLVDIETEKAVIEVPVPYDGTVISLAAEAGEMVKVGSVLAVFDTGQAEEADAIYRRLLTRSPGPAQPAALLAAARVAIELGDEDGADDLLLRLRSQYPESPEAVEARRLDDRVRDPEGPGS